MNLFRCLAVKGGEAGDGVDLFKPVFLGSEEAWHWMRAMWLGERC